MSSTALPAIQVKRQKILKGMSEALREVATDFEDMLGKAAKGVIMIHYDMGHRIAEVIANDKAYGAEAVVQLAEYLNIPKGTSTLYKLRQFAEAFEKDFVKEQSARQMGNGGNLEPGHWFQLMRITDEKDLLKVMNRVFSESLSVNELEQEIRAGIVKTKNTRSGGRKPQSPTSAIAGVQKMYSLSLQLGRFTDVAEESVFDAIDEMASDKVSPDFLKKLETTRSTIAETEEKLESSLKRLDENIKRVKGMLSKKPKDDEKAESNGKAAPAAAKEKSKNKAKAKAKASA